jgi:alkanesulfonate monooxygenase SsuD/methylene tetrahydromethanopterin reductase-like flavin-dependent oxidoreductase (luciferase family)
VWLSEHHLFEDGYLPQPLSLAAALAVRTSRIRIGTAVVLLPLHHPMEVAEPAALVDILSSGRLELGLGAGYRLPEFAAFGADFTCRYAAFEERVGAIRALWADGITTPPPVQEPVPLWAGFLGPRGARLAGRLDMGLLSARRSLLDPYREGLREGGHNDDRARMKGAVDLVVADDPEEAWTRLRPHAAYQRDSYARYAAEGTGTAAPVVPDWWDRDRGQGPGEGPRPYPVLDPAGAVARIVALADGLPLEEVFCWATVAGMPEDLAWRHVELLLTEVAPAVARHSQAAATKPG